MEVKLTKVADKQKCPKHIQIKFDYWVDLVITTGLREVRKYRGFHDEPLQGTRWGQRSVRLSKAYRIIYREFKGLRFEVIEVIEVNKHEY